MNLRTFIERPVLSAVISITIVVVGIIGLFSLPVEQYPDIAPPTIMVSTTYYGASAETLQKSVIAPLEEAINGVEDMTYMTSSATNSGSVSITVYFKQDRVPATQKATLPTIYTLDVLPRNPCRTALFLSGWDNTLSGTLYFL